MQDNEPVEPARLGDGPWLVAARGIDLVHGDGGDGVGGRDGEWHARIVGLLVELGWEVEWGVWRWWRCERSWVGRGWEVEEGGGWGGEVDVWRHGEGRGSNRAPRYDAADCSIDFLRYRSVDDADKR